jgi:hypothetical protein
MQLASHAAAPTVHTMGDLFARHQARIATAPPAPNPRPSSPAAPAAPAARPAVQRIARGDGYELRVGKVRVATVLPVAGGFVVANVEAGHKATVPDARQADALAARIARIAALPAGRGEE